MVSAGTARGEPSQLPILAGANLSPRLGAALLPQLLRNTEGTDVEMAPPGNFIAGLMQLPVMTAAEWNGEFIAHFKPEGSRLCKPQMMRVSRLTPANKAGLGSHKF